MAGHSAHVGVALSCVDIIAVLYERILNCTPDTVTDPHRDRFILSKGHGCMALYAVLAQQGYIDRSLLSTYSRNGSPLAEHPLAGKVPGIECATGSLGHGLAIGAGMAGGLKLQGSRAKVYVLLGDGECGEGSVWEGAALASAARLDNLTVLIDENNLQACAPCNTISPQVDLSRCWSGFGWHVSGVDGHSYEDMAREFAAPGPAGVPRVILCRTVKGRGIDFMENDLEWHYRPVCGTEYDKALQRLNHA